MSSKNELIKTLSDLNIHYKKWWSKDKLQKILWEYNLRTKCQRCGEVGTTFMVIIDPPFEDECLDYSGDEHSRYCESTYMCKICAKKSGGWIQISDISDFVLQQK
jgi:hypothetical protein